MAQDAFVFRWDVPKDGYKWIEARTYVDQRGEPARTMNESCRLNDEPEWVLTDGLGIGSGYYRKRYDPLSGPTPLFRTFADVPRDNRDDILAFANTYGMLGMRVGCERIESVVGRFVETWATWRTEIIEMRRAVAIWSMLEDHDIVGLSRHIRWEDHKPPNKPMWVYWSHPEVRDGGNKALRTVLDSGEGFHSDGIEPVEDLFTPDDVLMPASFLVQRWINKKLKGNASPQLRYDIERGERILQVIPDTLLSAMWLQFAQTFAGHRKHRACKTCGRWFEISTEDTGFRVNRQFCSDACKSKDYRDRKDQARQQQ
jgi:hypothetical protein